MSAWVMVLVPTGKAERAIFGCDPFVIYESSRGPGREVRLATDQETGLFARRALPRPPEVSPPSCNGETSR